MSKKIGVAILGGTGYGAGELLRLSVSHPEIELVSVVSSSKSGKSITDVHPHLLGFYDQCLVSEIDFKILNSFEHKVVIASLPHGASAKAIIDLLPSLDKIDAKLIDLSGDFRLRSETEHKLHYPESPFIPEIRNRFAYGLPEINHERIEHASLITNPGCLASACALVAAPIISYGYTGSIVFDAKTGTSGAGKTPTEVTHHASRTSNLSAYKILAHRHEPELREALQLAKNSNTMFVPHLLPSARGIFVTAYFTFENENEAQALEEHARNFYRHAPFVRFRKGSPELQHVIGTNFFDYSISIRKHQVVAMGVIDNLVKGMAGMAIQNMNIMCGMAETTGLYTPSLGPV